VGSLLDASAVQPSRTAAEHLLALARSNGIDRARVTVLEAVGLAAVARTRAGTFSLDMLHGSPSPRRLRLSNVPPPSPQSAAEPGRHEFTKTSAREEKARANARPPGFGHRQYSQWIRDALNTDLGRR
jgi:hypothetical protein